MADEIRLSIEDVAQHFEELEDPRSQINRRHPLISVVMISLMGVLAGAGGPSAIADWAMIKQDLLLRLLPLPHGIPKKDVYRRVLAALKPQAFQACFASWLSSLRTAAEESSSLERPVFAIDGKTARRSHDHGRGLGPLHSVSAWASDYGLSLGQVATDQKSNEITAIPELLKLIDIKGAIITLDAMGTQTAIAKQIVDGGADYVLPVKGNQGTLQQTVVGYVDRQIENDFADVTARRHLTREKGHGREETRITIQMPVPQDLPGLDRWKGIRTIGVVVLLCLRDGVETTMMRYYISSLGMGVKRFAGAARSHWGIENSCHWSLDITYREDESRIRHEHLRENFSWLNRFTLSLLKQHPARTSIIMKRRRCGWSDTFLTEVLTGETN